MCMRNHRNAANSEMANYKLFFFVLNQVNTAKRMRKRIALPALKIRNDSMSLIPYCMCKKAVFFKRSVCCWSYPVAPRKKKTPIFTKFLPQKAFSLCSHYNQSMSISNNCLSSLLWLKCALIGQILK